MKKQLLIALFTLSTNIVLPKLPFHDELVMAKAIPCDDSGVSISVNSGSITAPDPFAAYAPFIIGMSDCQALIYIINHIIVGAIALPRPITVEYLYLKYYTKLNGNFDDCDLGFYLDRTNNIFDALVALTFSNFTGSTMQRSIWQNMYLCGSNFSHVNAQSASFAGVVAPGIIFCYANLSNANFFHAYMPQSYFNSLPNSPKTNLTGANFNQVTLFRAKFQNSILRYANFFYCDMDHVKLQGADCSFASFHNCFGTFHVSPSTDFTKARFDQVDRIYFDIPEGQSPIFDETVMPDNTICTGPECVKYFRRLESTLPSVGV